MIHPFPSVPHAFARRGVVCVALVILFGDLCYSREHRREGAPTPSAARLPPNALVRFGSVALSHKDKLQCVAVAADGKRLASAGRDYRLRFWDVASGQQLWEIAERQVIKSLVFSADGRRLASVEYGGGAVKVWDVQAPRLLMEITPRTKVHLLPAFSADGGLLALEGPEHVIGLWQVGPGKSPRSLRGHRTPISALVFSPDGSLLASGGSDGQIRLWDVRAGKQLAVLGTAWGPAEKAENRVITSLALSPGGKLLAAGRQGGDILVFDRPSNKEVCRVRHAAGDAVFQAVFTHRGTRLTSVSNSEAACWEMPAGRRRWRVDPPLSRMRTVAPDGELLAVSSGCKIILYDGPTGKQRPRPPQHDGPVFAVAFTPNGGRLATCSRDGTLRLWQAAMGKPLCVIAHRRNFCNSNYPVYFSEHGKRILVAFGDGNGPFGVGGDSTVVAWEIGTGRKVFERRWPDSTIGAFAVSVDGKHLAVRILDDKANRIQVWDLSADTEQRSFPAPKQPPGGAVLESSEGMAFSPDGSLLAYSAFTFTIYLHDVKSGKTLRTLTGHKASISTLCFSPDGGLIASGTAQMGFNGGAVDPTVRLWDTATGKERFKIEAFNWPIYAVAFSPDGMLLAAASKDETIRLWEVATGQELFRFRDEGCHALAIAFSPTVDRLASAMSDGNALVWDLKPARWKVPDPPTAARLTSLWSDLASTNVGKGYRAVWSLAAAPKKAISLLRQHLKPIPQASATSIRKLVADLNADQFSAREKATDELARLGPQAEAELRRAFLAEKTSLEVRSRLKPLIETLDRWAVTDPETLRALRGVRVLERIGTKDARQLLRRLATGAPAARQTREAKAALQRLQRRRLLP